LHEHALPEPERQTNLQNPVNSAFENVFSLPNINIPNKVLYLFGH
jgi:hypothetical protein